MGVFNSKATVQKRQVFLSKTNGDPRQQKGEGSLHVKCHQNGHRRDQNDIEIENIEKELECGSKGPQVTSGKRPPNLPQYKWLMSCPVERDDFEEVRDFGRIKYARPGLPLRGDKAMDAMTSQTAASSSRSKAENFTRNSLSDLFSGENTTTARSRDETRFEQSKSSKCSSDSDASVLSDSLHYSGSVGFGVLMPGDLYLNKFVSGGGVQVK